MNKHLSAVSRLRRMPLRAESLMEKRQQVDDFGVFADVLAEVWALFQAIFNSGGD